jgi:predicted 3-demethylubiquinone-9 3-methyltransferase (glyoxalase superfamily)
MAAITPSLWFDYNLEDAATFYTSVFPNSQIEAFNRYSDAGPGEPGQVVSGTFVLDGVRFIGINGGPQFPFSEAVSFTVRCTDQDEVDYYWDRPDRRRRGIAVRLVEGPLRAELADSPGPAV